MITNITKDGTVIGRLMAERKKGKGKVVFITKYQNINEFAIGKPAMVDIIKEFPTALHGTTLAKATT